MGQSRHEATRESGAGADTIQNEDAVEALLQLAASGSDKNVTEKYVQVDSLSIVSRKLNLTESLSTDITVRAFTGVESVKTFHSICNEVALIDNASEVSVLDRVAFVLVRIDFCHLIA